jgi:hypothetical protein
MREYRLSGSVEGVVCKHDSYSDCAPVKPAVFRQSMITSTLLLFLSRGPKIRINQEPLQGGPLLEIEQRVTAR